MTRQNQPEPTNVWGILAILARSSPTAIAVLVLVFLFFRQEDNRANHNRRADDLRYEQCHAIQERAIDTLDRVTTALNRVERTLDRITQQDAATPN